MRSNCQVTVHIVHYMPLSSFNCANASNWIYQRSWNFKLVGKLPTCLYVIIFVSSSHLVLIPLSFVLKNFLWKSLRTSPVSRIVKSETGCSAAVRDTAQDALQDAARRKIFRTTSSHQRARSWSELADSVIDVSLLHFRSSSCLVKPELKGCWNLNKLDLKRTGPEFCLCWYAVHPVCSQLYCSSIRVSK